MPARLPRDQERGAPDDAIGVERHLAGSVHHRAEVGGVGEGPALGRRGLYDHDPAQPAVGEAHDGARELGILGGLGGGREREVQAHHRGPRALDAADYLGEVRAG